MANLEPHRFQPGENYHTRKAAERAQLESEIVAEFGSELTATDRLELRHAVELLTRRPRDHVDAVRCSNAGSRIIAKVRARIKQREGNRPPSETPRLMPEKAPLDLTAVEEPEPLAALVERRRARQDALEGRPIEVLDSGLVRVLPRPGSNGGDDDSKD